MKTIESFDPNTQKRLVLEGQNRLLDLETPKSRKNKYLKLISYILS